MVSPYVLIRGKVGQFPNFLLIFPCKAPKRQKFRLSSDIIPVYSMLIFCFLSTNIPVVLTLLTNFYIMFLRGTQTQEKFLLDFL